jgi:hypothetical protein
MGIIGIVALSDKFDSKVAFSGKASQFAEEYKKNVKAADLKYKDKTIKINGEVLRKGQFVNTNNIYLVLYNKDNVNVLVDFSLDQKSKVNAIKEGEFVEIKGTCQGRVEQKNKNEISIQIADADISR